MMVDKSDNLEFVPSPKLALLERVRDHLIEAHRQQILHDDSMTHLLVGDCPCDLAADYRQVKAWIRKQYQLRAAEDE